MARRASSRRRRPPGSPGRRWKRSAGNSFRESTATFPSISRTCTSPGALRREHNPIARADYDSGNRRLLKVLLPADNDAHLRQEE